MECNLLDKLDTVMDMVTVKYLFIDKEIFTKKFGTSITKDITEEKIRAKIMVRYNLTESQANDYMNPAMQMHMVEMTIGVVPTKVEERDCVSGSMDVHIPCDNLNDRKELMMAQSDAFVALPGGIGTLDELFTVAASATIGYHRKPLVLYNMNGFWDSLVAMLDDLKEKGVIRGDWHSVIEVANTLEEVVAALNNV